MKNGDFYAVFGGFGPQNWVNIRKPDIEGKADGLTTCIVDGETGSLYVVDQSHGIVSPSTLVVSKDNRFIYAGNETHDYKVRGYGGGVTSFAFDMETGRTTPLNDSYAFGSATAYCALDRSGKFLFVANCGSKFYVSRYEEVDGKMRPVVLRDEGVVCMFEILEDGRIGELLDRLVLTGTGADPVEHASAHPHSILIDEKDFIVIPNKGGDDVYVAKLDRKRRRMELLSTTKCEYGSSPRHVAFVPNTDFVLIQEEFGGHLNSFRLDRNTGVLEHISRVDTYDPSFDRPKDEFCGFSFSRPWGIDVQVHPNGRWVYCNNTQPVVCQFEIDVTTGKLHHVATVDGIAKAMTRGIQIDRIGRFLVTTAPLDDKAMVYKLDPLTGVPVYVSQVDLPTPTAVRFIYPEEVLA